jgi:hypothetical protein
VTTPADWTMKLDDHGPQGLVVEIRHRAQLLHRSTVTLDQVVCEDAIGALVRRWHPTLERTQR